MLKRTRLRIAALAAVAAMTVGGAAATEASAQGPIVTGGLVNVTVVDVVDVNNNAVNANIQIPIGVAANVGACVGANLNVLSVQEMRDQTFDCTIDQQQQFNQMPVAFQRAAVNATPPAP